MNFETLRETFGKIETSINSLRNGVDLYSTDVMKLNDLQDQIMQRAMDSEDSILFLIRLNEQLIVELETVEEEQGDVSEEVEELNRVIRDLQDQIAAKNQQIANIQTRVQNELGIIDQIANNQVGRLQDIQNDLVSAN